MTEPLSFHHAGGLRGADSAPDSASEQPRQTLACVRSAQNYSLVNLVGEAGLEPATSCSQGTRATICATPRRPVPKASARYPKAVQALFTGGVADRPLPRTCCRRHPTHPRRQRRWVRPAAGSRCPRSVPPARGPGSDYDACQDRTHAEQGYVVAAIPPHEVRESRVELNSVAKLEAQSAHDALQCREVGGTAPLHGVAERLRINPSGPGESSPCHPAEDAMPLDHVSANGPAKGRNARLRAEP